MAVGAWEVYDQVLEYLMDATIDLDTETFSLALFTSGSNASTLTLSTLGSVTNQLASGNNYSSSGRQLSGETWASGASSGERRFDATDIVLTASGGNWSNVQFAVIYERSGGLILCKSKLSTTAFDILDGNTLTITFDALGIFELNRA